MGNGNSVEQELDLSLIIACYMEEGHLKDSVRQVIDILDTLKVRYELIFVEDCSRDRTREIIDELSVHYAEKNIKKICHEKNAGRGKTVSDGFRVARGCVVGYIDIDLEIHARYIPDFYLAIRNGADVAVAHRIYNFKITSIDRYMMSRGYNFLLRRLLHIPFTDTEAGYKFFRRDKLLDFIDEIEDPGWFWDSEVMVRAFLHNCRIVEIPTLFLRRSDKKSTVNNIKDTLDYMKRVYRFRRKVLPALRKGAGAG
ncbi:MAG: glycosyltransferase family 2 protein [bacterium]